MYLWCVLGTSWCILLKIKSYFQAQRDITVEGYCILVDQCERTFIGVERNVGVNRNCTKPNSANVAEKIENIFLR
jgi:hypothetical protein